MPTEVCPHELELLAGGSWGIVRGSTAYLVVVRMVCTRLCIVFLQCSLLTLIAATRSDIVFMLGLVLELADLMLVLTGLMSLALVATSMVLRIVALELVVFMLVAADLAFIACVRGSIAFGGFVAAVLVSLIFTSGGTATLSSPDTQAFAVYLCCRNVDEVCPFAEIIDCMVRGDIWVDRRIDILIAEFSQRGHATGSCTLPPFAASHRVFHSAMDWRMTAALRWTGLTVVRGIHVTLIEFVDV
jgi:hypothetical protein